MTVSLLPGRGYSPAHPLLYYATALLEARGRTVRPVAWTGRPEDPAEWPGFVRTTVAADWQEHGLPTLVVAKSLGTHALPLAVEHGLPGVWLTPLPTEPAQREALAAAKAPQLVLAGTADPFWDRAAVAPNDAVEVVELSGLDHGLEQPGDPFASLSALAEVLRRLDAFLTS